ncbi:hypothetical protein [Paenilisteria newyorkensis]|uniref:hypothetical protein n=1 Tax=Listeria newyorkensis TaxID=1497681 RepID=UPI00066A0626|nr:hypothetical protein [Listeria newyorkensis]KMT58928.1 hypothetical protein X559_2934 [Listeria newyorkensis]
MDELTNDAKYLLSRMYACYLERRKNGDSKADAIEFNEIDSIREKLMPEWSMEDVEFTCFELHSHNYIQGMALENTLSFIKLSTKAIAGLESTFKDRIDSVLEYGAKIKNVIPFI